jgi:hypothetical protein
MNNYLIRNLVTIYVTLIYTKGNICDIFEQEIEELLEDTGQGLGWGLNFNPTHTHSYLCSHGRVYTPIPPCTYVRVCVLPPPRLRPIAPSLTPARKEKICKRFSIYAEILILKLNCSTPAGELECLSSFFFRSDDNYKSFRFFLIFTNFFFLLL